MIRGGGRERRFRGLPMGSRQVWIVLRVPRREKGADISRNPAPTACHAWVSGFGARDFHLALLRRLEGIGGDRRGLRPLCSGSRSGKTEEHSGDRGDPGHRKLQPHGVQT